MIKAIVFDYMEVIAPSPIKSWIYKNLPNPTERLETLGSYGNKWDRGGVDLNNFYEILSKVTDVPAKSIWDTFYKNHPADKEIINIIKKLKKHYKIILFSNNCGDNLRLLMKKQKIYSLFDEIIISSDYQMTKPDPKVYVLMLLIAKIDVSEAIFIDDRQINVDAGNKLGIKSLLFTNPQKLITDLKSQNIIL